MFNNITCQKFKNDIDNLILNSNLPPVVAYYILKDSLSQLEKLSQEVLNYEMEQQQNKEQDQQEEAE